MIHIIKPLAVIAALCMIIAGCYAIPASGDVPQETAPVTTTEDITNMPPETTQPEITEPETTTPTTEPTVPETTEPPHVHEYNQEIIHPECINNGYTVYLCKCGDEYTGDETEALGHQWKNWNVVIEPTWFTGGREARTCSRCDFSEARDINRRVIANSGTIIIPKSQNILDYLIEPKPEDFGKYYENAVTLYNAFMNKQEESLGLFFSEETYELERAEWRKFKRIFEEKCFQNCGVSIMKDSFTTGAFPEGAGLTRINLHVNKTQELYTACLNAMHAMGLYDGMSKYEAVYTMNEWMRRNIVYELGHPDALDTLQTGKAQCAGYADLFEFFCFYVDIDAKYVTGCVGHEDGPCQYGCHAWNRVKLAGDWYYLDICWNDADTPNRYYLTQELWAGRTAMSESDPA